MQIFSVNIFMNILFTFYIYNINYKKSHDLVTLTSPDKENS